MFQPEEFVSGQATHIRTLLRVLNMPRLLLCPDLLEIGCAIEPYPAVAAANGDYPFVRRYDETFNAHPGVNFRNHAS